MTFAEWKEYGYENFDILNIFWSREDVSSLAETLEIDLTEEQIDDICRRLEHNFDAQYGLNWNIIEQVILEEAQP